MGKHQNTEVDEDAYDPFDDDIGSLWLSATMTMKREEDRKSRRFWRWVSLLIIVGFILSPFASAVAALIVSMCSFLSELTTDALRIGVRVLGVVRVQLIVGIGTILLGALAFWFKRRQQFAYGVCEVVFAAASAIAVSLRMHPGETMLSQWATLIGCAYIVARGLGNIYSDNRGIESCEDTADDWRWKLASMRGQWSRGFESWKTSIDEKVGSGFKSILHDIQHYMQGSPE